MSALVLLASNEAARAVDAATPVHEFCETRRERDADLIATIDDRRNATMCIHIPGNCGNQKLVYFKKSGGVLVHISPTNAYCK